MGKDTEEDKDLLGKLDRRTKHALRMMYREDRSNDYTNKEIWSLVGLFSATAAISLCTGASIFAVPIISGIVSLIGYPLLSMLVPFKSETTKFKDSKLARIVDNFMMRRYKRRINDIYKSAPGAIPVQYDGEYRVFIINSPKLITGDKLIDTNVVANKLKELYGRPLAAAKSKWTTIYVFPGTDKLESSLDTLQTGPDDYEGIVHRHFQDYYKYLGFDSDDYCYRMIEQHDDKRTHARNEAIVDQIRHRIVEAKDNCERLSVLIGSEKYVGDYRSWPVKAISSLDNMDKRIDELVKAVKGTKFENAMNVNMRNELRSILKTVDEINDISDNLANVLQESDDAKELIKASRNLSDAVMVMRKGE
jgi:hypothetical protein